VAPCGRRFRPNVEWLEARRAPAVVAAPKTINLAPADVAAANGRAAGAPAIVVGASAPRLLAGEPALPAPAPVPTPLATSAAFSGGPGVRADLFGVSVRDAVTHEVVANAAPPAEPRQPPPMPEAVETPPAATPPEPMAGQPDAAKYLTCAFAAPDENDVAPPMPAPRVAVSVPAETRVIELAAPRRPAPVAAARPVRIVPAQRPSLAAVFARAALPVLLWVASWEVRLPRRDRNGPRVIVARLLAGGPAIGVA
jgi:hypothetical protein